MPPPFPILFTLPPSNRHEFITLDTSSSAGFGSSANNNNNAPAIPSLKALNKLITATMATSPNCEEFMSRHKPKPETSTSSGPTIQQLRIHWDTKGRDSRIWPEYTIVTEENLGAVLGVLGAEFGSGVLEVKVGEGE